MTALPRRARSQARIDRLQRRRAAKLRRQQARARAWALLQPLALAIGAVTAFISAGASTGLLVTEANRPLGVSLVVGSLAAAVGLAVLEWRLDDD